MPTLLWANYDYDCIIIVAVFRWIIVLFHYCTVLFMLMLMMMLIKLHIISYHIISYSEKLDLGFFTLDRFRK